MNAVFDRAGRLLRARGYDLHLVGRGEEALSAVAAELGATWTVGDVTDEHLFARVTNEAGAPLHGLVYAVGTITLRSFPRLTEADFLNDFRVNAMGAARAIQAALPALKKSPAIASVVLFSSVAALQGFAFHGSIGMAKGAVNGLTLSLANELAPAGARQCHRPFAHSHAARQGHPVEREDDGGHC